MKGTVWLWPVLTTLLCISQLASTAQRQYMDFGGPNEIQDDFALNKRAGPSLSIINPLEVLRKRLLLEMARRQMRQHAKQAEINRNILKSIGKRSSSQNVLDFLRHVPPNNTNDISGINENFNRNDMAKNYESEQEKDYYNENNEDYDLPLPYSLQKARSMNK